MAPNITEMTNDEFERDGIYCTMEDLDAELVRVRGIIEANAMTGTDLSYWFRREELIQDEQRGHL